MAVSLRILILFAYTCSLAYIYAERTQNRNIVHKMLREMVNQTKADTLNLPANATSIRENITDTFSCENRTYGYYADVDNECQVFHVCMSSQTSSGRNITYRWSFICPNETVFNQEVLTCTRPRDAIDCEESPMFYYLNMDIGKVPNDTNTQANPGNNTSRRKPIKRQNLIVENLMREVKNANLFAEVLEDDLAPVVEEGTTKIEEFDNLSVEVESMKETLTEEVTKPVVRKVDDEYFIKEKSEENSILASEKSLKRRGGKQNKESFLPVEAETMTVDVKNPVVLKVDEEYFIKEKSMDNSRLASENSLKRRGRKLSRGSFRFKADRLN